MNITRCVQLVTITVHIKLAAVGLAALCFDMLHVWQHRVTKNMPPKRSCNSPTTHRSITKDCSRSAVFLAISTAATNASPLASPCTTNGPGGSASTSSTHSATIYSKPISRHPSLSMWLHLRCSPCVSRARVMDKHNESKLS